MVAYSILLNLLIIIGVGGIVGILVTVILVNMKLSTLIRTMSELNKNHGNIKLNSSHNSKESNVNQAQIQKNVVSAVPYKNDLDAHAAPFKEEQLIQEKIDSLQKTVSLNEVKKQKVDEANSPAVVGIVFCRNCTSQFTSDKDSCPICGAKRQ